MDNTAKDTKRLEVNYDAEAIPGYDPSRPDLFKSLAFGDAARAVIESALDSEQAGKWAGAQIDESSMSFGFRVKDFDRAEAVIAKAVDGTPYERIRTILRRGGMPFEEEV